MTNVLTVVDGNNWFRRRAETILTGNPVRNCFYEINNKQGVVIVVWDGFKALEKRRLVYPDYKMGRKPAGESIYESQNMLKQILELSKAIQIQVNGFEGDDVIAQVVENYRTQFDKIFIESNDLDLYQLNCPMSRDTFPEKSQWIRLYKTFVGDPSDNISGCKGFGKGAWAKLTDQDKEVLEHIMVCGWGYSEDQIEEMVKDFFAPKALEWFKNKENRQLMQKFYKIVGFLFVPDNEIIGGTKAGLNRPDLAENVFKEFML